MTNAAVKPANEMVPARLQVRRDVLAAREMDEAKWGVLVDAIFPSARSTEAVLLALDYCKARQLDPFKRPVHIVPMWNSTLNRMVETVWPGINSIETDAARTGQWAGMDPPKWGPDKTDKWTAAPSRGDRGPGKEVTITYPEWCEVTVYRLVNGVRCPFTEVVFWREACATDRNGCPNDMWQKRTRGQLHKCAKAAVLRAAFPEVADYAAEEMEGKDIKAGGVVIDADGVTVGRGEAKVETAPAAVPAKGPAAAFHAAAPRPARDVDPVTGEVAPQAAAPPADAPPADPLLVEVECDAEGVPTKGGWAAWTARMKTRLAECRSEEEIKALNAANARLLGVCRDRAKAAWGRWMDACAARAGEIADEASPPRAAPPDARFGNAA